MRQKPYHREKETQTTQQSKQNWQNNRVSCARALANFPTGSCLHWELLPWLSIISNISKVLATYLRTTSHIDCTACFIQASSNLQQRHPKYMRSARAGQRAQLSHSRLNVRHYRVKDCTDRFSHQHHRLPRHVRNEHNPFKDKRPLPI